MPEHGASFFNAARLDHASFLSILRPLVILCLSMLFPLTMLLFLSMLLALAILLFLSKLLPLAMLLFISKLLLLAMLVVRHVTGMVRIT